MRRYHLAALATAAGLLLAAPAPIAGTGGLAQAAPVVAVPVEPAASTTTEVPTDRAQIKLSFSSLVKSSSPAVVNVYAARTVTAKSPFEGDPFFEQFFGQRREPRPRIQSSLGSGVIVDASGLVVTNNHVIAGADEVKVALSDGREFASEILLKDERADLAILKIEGSEPFPALGIADSDAIEIGDLVLAIGNPFGIGQTVTNGIVSALARTHIGVNDFGYFIQTDAAINPGNSGGALIDMSGRLIGVNTAIYSRSGGSNGIGFAIPSNMVRAFVEAAKTGGRFERPFIGATFTAVTSDIAEAVGLDRPTGALVDSLYPGGPAEAAGLKPGSVVLALNDFKIGSTDALGYRLATTGIGKTVTLDVLSGGSQERLTLALIPPPEVPPRDLRQLMGETPFSGATIANPSPKMADELDMPQAMTGVVVVGVESGSFAERFGLQPKDVILELNGEPVNSTEALEDMASRSRRGWVYEIERNGRHLTRRVR